MQLSIIVEIDRFMTAPEVRIWKLVIDFPNRILRPLVIVEGWRQSQIVPRIPDSRFMGGKYNCVEVREYARAVFIKMTISTVRIGQQAVVFLVRNSNDRCRVGREINYTQYPLQETGSQISVLDISYFPLNFSTRVSQGVSYYFITC